MDVMDGRRAPFPPHRYGNGGDTRDTDTQAPSSGSDSSPSPRPGSPDGLRSVGGSPCSVEDADKGTRRRACVCVCVCVCACGVRTAAPPNEGSSPVCFLLPRFLMSLPTATEGNE